MDLTTIDLPSPEPLTNLFLARARASAERPAFYSKVDGQWVGTTWAMARQFVEETALGLLELGAGPQVPVAILSQTRPEWGLVDAANLFIGAITVGIYPTLNGSQIRQILELSGARIVVVEDRPLRVLVKEACENLAPRLTLITLEKEPEVAEHAVVTLDGLRRRGALRRQENPDELERRAGERKTNEVVSYIYTSGTTGEPKGAMLTHKNFHYVIHATNRLVPYDNERALVFLPMAHSLQRYASYLNLVADVEAYFAESLERVADNLLEVHPTCFAIVPRILEKIHSKVLASVDEASALRRRVFFRSLAVMERDGGKRRARLARGIRDRLRHRVADRLVGRRVRARMGGRVKFIGSGGAPLGRATHEFFENLGMPVLEGYGLTETSAPATMNTLTQRRIGTVGRPLLGTEVKIADDGEILIRGPGVFAGYFSNHQATQDAFDDQGWFVTGDIGTMSRDGFLTITDRKKDLIITAGGKNIAPQPIERELKRHPFLSQAVLLGDRQRYLVALVGLDDDARTTLARRHGLSDQASAEEVAAVPAVRNEIENHIGSINAQHPSFEQIKKFEVLPEDLSVTAGTLTPTLKVKRRVVADRYRDRIRRLYE